MKKYPPTWKFWVGILPKTLKTHLQSPEEDLESRIVNAAHFYITDWEFYIISQTSPGNFLRSEIDQSINRKRENTRDLECCKISRERGQGPEEFSRYCWPAQVPAEVEPSLPGTPDISTGAYAYSGHVLLSLFLYGREQAGKSA